jgi:hypothetical protein
MPPLPLLLPPPLFLLQLLVLQLLVRLLLVRLLLLTTPPFLPFILTGSFFGTSST